MNPESMRQRLKMLARTDRPRNEAPSIEVDGAVASLRIYDAIDSWGEMFGVSAREFVRALDELPDTVSEIRLSINSPGGDVFDAIAILNSLRNHPARVVATVDGIAASAASFIAVGADELVMGRNSELMIHDSWGLVVGNSADMREMADMLDRHSNNIAQIYADKTGDPVEFWRDAMRGESWYSADEAVAAGLADRAVSGDRADRASNAFDLSAFNHQGREQAPAPPMPGQKISTETPDESPAVNAAGDDRPAVDVVPSVHSRKELARLHLAEI